MRARIFVHAPPLGDIATNFSAAVCGSRPYIVDDARSGIPKFVKGFRQQT